MKKIVAIVIALAIGVAVFSPIHNASAAPVGGGFGNQCQIPAVNNWCWLRYAAPLGSACVCDATGNYPGFVF